MFVGDAARDAERYQLLRDQLALYHQHAAGWSLWTYKDIGLQGLVYLPPDAPYLQRIAPVLAKKARLGVDHWHREPDLAAFPAGDDASPAPDYRLLMAA